MSLTITRILEIEAPQFTGDADINDYITLAKQQTSTCFGDSYNRAVALRVAHMMTLRDRNANGGSFAGAAGAVKQLKEGDASIQFGGVSLTLPADLSQTSYGVQLLGLTNQKILAVSVLGTQLIPCGD